ncbi:MAG: M14 family metallopeptidase [Flavobacteriales bacterium]|nr:M14 family metallopeptidase [Flavobacteriales bacterium]
MRKLFLFFLGFSLATTAQTKTDFTTPFEKSNGLNTATYQETISFYEKLAKVYPEISIKAMGLTDSGKPLHLVIFSADKEFDFDKIHKSKKNIILINNGIHPGEPDGIDASMMLLRDIVQNKRLKKSFENIVIAIIPIYNIGGSLNRNATTRVNQNGPTSYGFRGNARNFDLNRDFIKNDTKNAQSFAEIFHLVKPDVFIDNHVSNGADYQYTLTHLFTQHNKLGGNLGNYLHNKMMPEMLADLHKKGIDATPYVNVFNQVPEIGFSQFMDSPRYSTGYTTLFNTLGMMVETHMLKDYKPRVEVTYELMLSALNFIQKNGTNIKTVRQNAFDKILKEKTYPLTWEIDSTKTSTLQFKGFEGRYIKSDVTGLKRLKYYRDKPFTKPVTYYDYFKPKSSVAIPKAYVIPQGFWPIIARLKHNKVAMTQLEKDSLIQIEVYHIADYKTRKNAYEGHYLHYNTQTTTSIETIRVKKGDYLIPLMPYTARYILETLEPTAPDSFFNWNFFDTILQQKEGFSPYVFEDLAVEILNNNPQLKADFETKQKTDKAFSENWYAQLSYIYNHSKYKEPAFLRYPVYRIK